MRTIYDEGRVVGLSAYEIFVRNWAEFQPDIKPPTEREWLADSIGKGASMILVIKANTTAGYHDYYLPEGSLLCGPQPMLASLFEGDVGNTPDGNWAERVIRYGYTIENTSAKHPSTDGKTIPTGTLNEQNIAYEYKEFNKIVEGSIIQPGTWKADPILAQPEMDFTPNLKGRPFVRICFSEKIKREFKILISGFVSRSIFAAYYRETISALKSSRPADGDFLGASVFPWNAPITFVVSNEQYRVYEKFAIRRGIENNADSFVSGKPIVDMDGCNPIDYSDPEDPQKLSTIGYNVAEMNVLSNQCDILAISQRGNTRPALYGGKVTQEGYYRLAPIDVASPGTTKTFTNVTNALNYVKAISGVYAFYFDETKKKLYFVHKGCTTGKEIPLN